MKVKSIPAGVRRAEVGPRRPGWASGRRRGPNSTPAQVHSEAQDHPSAPHHPVARCNMEMPSPRLFPIGDCTT